jgi:cell division protein FtsI/penicillin-binding protein 2
MFAQRLLLLGVLFVVGAVLVAGQLGRLTLLQGERHRAEAASRLERSQWLPTSRGRILDRQGRVLAVDRPSYEVAVDYAVLDGSWAQDRGRRMARRLYRDEWGDLSAEERRALTQRCAERYTEHVEAAMGLLAEALGVERAELAERRREIGGRWWRSERGSV